LKIAGARGAPAIIVTLVACNPMAVGKQFSETPRTSAETETYAGALADMFCAYLKGLRRG
jgi:Tetracyclin repressor-like, C-terminal domain